MIRAAVVIILASGPIASADSISLAPVPFAAMGPRLAANESVCEAPLDHVLAKQVSFAGHEVRVLHECGNADTNAKLAFKAGDDWRVRTGALISYVAGNMTDAPLHVSLVSEHVTFSKLVGGRRVLLYRVDTLWQNIRPDSGVEYSERKSRVEMCAYIDDEPQCGYAEIVCPAKGCKPPDLSHGTLTLVTKDGVRDFSIE